MYQIPKKNLTCRIVNLLNIMYLSDYTDLSNLLGAFHIFLTQNLADHSNLANLKIRAKISTKFLDFSDLIDLSSLIFLPIRALLQNFVRDFSNILLQNSVSSKNLRSCVQKHSMKAKLLWTSFTLFNILDLVNLADLSFLANLKIRAKISKTSNILVRLELQNCFHSYMPVLTQSTFFMFRVGWIYWSLQTKIIGIHIRVSYVCICHYNSINSKGNI